MLKFLLVYTKLFLLLLAVGFFLLANLLVRLIFRDPHSRRKLHSRLTSLASRLGLKILNVNLKVYNSPLKTKAHLLVGNHLGFLDILLLSSERSSLFITSQEMRQTSGLGVITEMGGSLYVNRLSTRQLNQEATEIREALSAGFNVVLFPEARSNNGERVYPFKRSLLTSAVGTGIPVQPFVINYRRVNGIEMCHETRDFVCWYGETSFFTVLWRLLSTSQIEAEVKFLEPLEITSAEERKEIAEKIYLQVQAHYIPIPIPMEN